MRVLDAFPPREATWSGQVISSPPGPSRGPSKTHLLPGGGVPRVHRARSPVLPRLPRFATPRSVYQFAAVAAGAYPLRRPPNAWSPGEPAPPAPCYWLLASGNPSGLARRLPSLGVGAWRCAPLLPWRVQYPVCGCAALAAGSGGLGRYLVLRLSRFPLPAPRVPRCVWRAVPSGCPLPSLAGTPFHAVCAFRALGQVALLVVPACPFRLCALAHPRRPLPPPLGGVACAPRVVPALGAGGTVSRGPCPSACPAPVPCSVWRAWGGAVRSWFPPTWLGVVGVAVGRPRGGYVLLLRGASGVRRPPPPPDCPPTGRAVGVRDLRVVRAGVRLWAGRAPAPLSGRGGTIPPASGVGGRGPCGLRAGGGVGGGVVPRPRCSPSEWRPAELNPGPPRVIGALPSGVRVRSGSQCRPGVGGGLRGGPWTAPPGAPADLNPPSALPEWAVVTGGSGGARPPYVSVARVAPAR